MSAKLGPEYQALNLNVLLTARTYSVALARFVRTKNLQRKLTSCIITL